MLLDNGVRYTNAPDNWGGLVSQGGAWLASSFYATDLSGNARALADPTGAVTDSWAYSAFGEEIAASGSTATPFRFGGEWGYYRDDPERLYVRARHLDAASGRWLSRDPIGFAGGYNLYGCVGNDPVDGIDPSGFQSLDSAYQDDRTAAMAALDGGSYSGTIVRLQAKHAKYQQQAVDQANIEFTVLSFADGTGEILSAGRGLIAIFERVGAREVVEGARPGGFWYERLVAITSNLSILLLPRSCKRMPD